MSSTVDSSGMLIVLLIAPLMIKFGLIALLARLFGASPGIALRTGLGLAQGGEFGFVLLAYAGQAKLASETFLQPVLAAMVLSMLIAPFIIQRSDAIVRRLSANDWMLRAMQIHNIAVQSMAVEEHVLICGYGRSGQNLARFLEQEKIPVIALDMQRFPRIFFWRSVGCGERLIPTCRTLSPRSA